MNLFPDLPETKSPRLRWMERHGFLTWHTPDMEPEEDPWMAIIPITGDKGKHIADIMAESCRLYEEGFGIGYGKTEEEAVVSLAIKKGIPLWNEEPSSLHFT